MEYPRMIYKDRRTHCIVHSHNEHMVKKAEGWMLHWDPEINALKQKPETKAISQSIIEEDEKTSISETPVFEESAPNFDEFPTLEEQYKNSTGKSATNKKGRWKGQDTREFKKWKKMHKEL